MSEHNNNIELMKLLMTIVVVAIHIGLLVKSKRISDIREKR